MLEDPPHVDVPVSEFDPESKATKRACVRHHSGESSGRIPVLHLASRGRNHHGSFSHVRFSVTVRLAVHIQQPEHW